MLPLASRSGRLAVLLLVDEGPVRDTLRLRRVAVAIGCSVQTTRYPAALLTDEAIERLVLRRVKLRPKFIKLNTIPGVGNILGRTVMLEAGHMGRFRGVGNFASYCRCVDSRKWSNAKKKGAGNVKNGNKSLAWAFVEAAHFAVRHSPAFRRFYERKKARTNGIVAIKTVAHKLARAAFYLLRDQVPFDVQRAFG